jgi:UPF0755 protein
VTDQAPTDPEIRTPEQPDPSRLVPPPHIAEPHAEALPEDTAEPALPPVPRRPAELLPPPAPAEGYVAGEPPPPPSRGARGGLIALAVVALLVAGALFGAWWYLGRRTGSSVASGKSVSVTIKQGSDVEAIAAALARAGVVNNVNMFQLSVRSSGLGDQLKSGTYDLTTGMPDDAVIDVLAMGSTSGVTIPEGATIRSIAAKLQKDAGIPAAEFTKIASTQAKSFHKPFLADNPTKSLEGYLFPKTYAIKKGTSARQAIELMLDQFGTEIGAVDLSYARSKNLTLHDVVTIASIVEKETPLSRERRLVSSVVYNRLRRRMQLGMESTVRYALGGKAGTLTYADVRVDNPFNTYIHKGLPPGPICNPGIAALDAAAHPADTKYLFFVTTGKDGSSTFTDNAADFEAAKARGVH